MSEHTATSVFSLPVFRSQALFVSTGANHGDSLSFADDLVHEDSYLLRHGARAARLSVHPGSDDSFIVAQSTEIGHAGAAVHLDSCLTFMSSDGSTTEVLILVEVDADGNAAEIYALPLMPLQPKCDYVLVGIDQTGARAKLAEVACVSFTVGTHITLASGAQRRIESLRVGDRVLTRDDGPQEIRWIGQSTVRAVGEFAPILIRAGTLHNDHDLIVSPEHRLFIYQRSDELGAGRSELLIRARNLVNGTTIVRQDGGFVDYYQLLFDDHQIIYAEGIAAETLLLDPRTSPALPPEVAARLRERGLRHSDRSYLDFDIKPQRPDAPDIATLLRRASTG
ncbi:Hint domain-containing protein [Thalassovita taeanensis]|uniref:Hint domain-containing protein n=1 Tax=Thalassovita taeanensis TaxID=657014 RepID=A0A1H9FR77_9RHOB|nr:Hint domain-containing protein [Thalassovita taeanensis]SEQ40414.1 Hint domain-containing protein [Thalassovita taeanensis]